MTRVVLAAVLAIGISVLATGGAARAAGLSDDVGPPPVITSPEENEWVACNAPVDYCWELPEGVVPEDVSGYELQFSNT